MLRSLGVTAAVVALVWADPGGLLGDFERRALDARALAFARPTPFTDRIVIIDITDDSLARLARRYGRWPWSRAAYAELVDALLADGALAIGFDLLFVEEEHASALDRARWGKLSAFSKNADLSDVREQLQREFDDLEPGRGDAAFVAATTRAGVVFQAAVFGPMPSTGRPTPPDLPPPVPLPTQVQDAVRPRATLPFPALARASRGVGHINASPDADGTYRRFHPLLWAPDASAAFPSLALALAAHVRGLPLSALARTAGGLRLADLTLPLEPDETAWLHFQGGPSAYRHVAFEQVLADAERGAAGGAPQLARGTFKDAVVLVSATAAGLPDLRATPFSAVTPGIELHANALDSLLAGEVLQSPPRFSALFVVALLAAVLAVALTRLAPAPGLLLASGLVAAVAASGWYAYGAGLVVPLVPSTAALSAATGAALAVRAARAEGERRWLREAFSHYLAPAVLEQVLRAPERLALGGERRRVTVLFSDVAGFTSFSERLAPEAVAALLNDYLGRMVGCVSETAGTVDKFVGDAVMAEWNAPLDQPDHAARACEAALAMQREVSRHRARWEAVTGAAFEVRVGLNTGEVVVGNMGSPDIFDYTVLGNEVNTAARLEPLNKAFGTRVLVAGSTRRDAEAHRPGVFAFRRLASVMPKGREAPLDVHELVGLSDELTASQRASLGRFEAGMDEYLAGRFEEARRVFLEAAGVDAPAAVFAQRCQELLDRPPDGPWLGVLVQTEK